MFSKRLVKSVFIDSLPVLTGYITMGFGAGVLLAKEANINNAVLWSFITSAGSISGALQYLLVDWIKQNIPFLQIAFLTIFLNIRYAFYGISLIERFKSIPIWQKFYLIWTLTDETYALEVANHVPKGESNIKYCLLIAGFNHLYWIVGVVSGTIIGGAVNFNSSGLSFAMTAVFIVVLTEQWQAKNNRIPAVIGIISSSICLVALPLNKMLPVSILITLITLLALKKKQNKNTDKSSEEN